MIATSYAHRALEGYRRLVDLFQNSRLSTYRRFAVEYSISYDTLLSSMPIKISSITWFFQPRPSQSRYTPCTLCKPCIVSTGSEPATTRASDPFKPSACGMCMLAWWLSALTTLQDVPATALGKHVSSLAILDSVKATRDEALNTYRIHAHAHSQDRRNAGLDVLTI